MLESVLCRAEHFGTEWFERWAVALKVAMWPQRKHRKEWEWAAICQALDERGKLGPQSTGLGFAVGQEPLASLFASMGAVVTATDLTEGQDAEHWQHNNQLAGGLEQIFRADIVDRPVFGDRVTFHHADMNDIDALPSNFDFIWSSCALEHLGSIEKGLEFVRKSALHLKVGGVAAHTTEFNLTSLTSTIDEGIQVFYRASDLQQLDFDLRKQFCCLERLDLFPGTERDDVLYDFPPFYENGHEHVKLQLENYVTTSVLLIVRRFR